MTLHRTLMVPGTPVPQGSTKAFAVKGKAFTTSTNAGPLAKYRNDIRYQWDSHPIRIPPPTAEPIVMNITFTFTRPQAHYLPANSKRPVKELRPNASHYVVKKPDLDKLVRAVGDALTGFAFNDDAQVVALQASKVWGSKCSTAIEVLTMAELDESLRSPE